MKARVNRVLGRAGRMVVALVLGICLASMPVMAQGDEAPAQAPKIPGLKSPAMAFSLSLAGTLLSWSGLLAEVPGAWLGVFIGPSLGYIYGGFWGRALLGTGLRAVAALGMFGGLIGSFDAYPGHSSSAEGVMLGSAAVFIASSLWDILSAPVLIQRQNARLRETHLAMTPFFLPQSKSVGIQVSFSF